MKIFTLLVCLLFAACSTAPLSSRAPSEKKQLVKKNQNNWLYIPHFSDSR